MHDVPRWVLRVALGITLVADRSALAAQYFAHPELQQEAVVGGQAAFLARSAQQQFAVLYRDTADAGPRAALLGRLYHLAAAHPLSWYEFARTIVGLAARRGFALRMDADAVRPILTGELAQAVRRPLNSRLDCSRLESALGLAMPDWQPFLEQVLQLLALKQNGY